MNHPAPPWLPDTRVVMAQLASGIREYAQQISSAQPFRLPYPPNLQLAFDKLTQLSWHQGVAPLGSVVELLQLAHQPFGDWPISLGDVDVGADEALVSWGRPTTTCEELGALQGDVEGEMRENALMRAVMDKTRAADAPASYVAFRKLLIEHPAITALALDQQLATAALALLADELRHAYVAAPPEAAAAGVVRTCGGCQGLRLPLDGGRTWYCEDVSCPAPGTTGEEHPASEGMWWLRRELRTFITGPGRAELRIAKAVERLGVPVALWPDFDTFDLSVFADRPWVADVKAWRHPARLASRLRDRLFAVPADTGQAYIVIAAEQVKAQPQYLERLRKACPSIRPGQRIVAVSEADFVRRVAARADAGI